MRNIYSYKFVHNKEKKMSLKNTSAEYGSIAKLFHWGMFAMFVFMFILAEIMDELEKGEEKWMLYGWHKSTGILLLAIIVLRILWRISNINPLLPSKMKSHERILAHLGHFALYVCMIGLPLSGYVMSMAGGHGISFYGFFDIVNLLVENKELAHSAHDAHEFFAEAIYILVPLHILAALYHHIILKDNTLDKMRPKKKQ